MGLHGDVRKFHEKFGFTVSEYPKPLPSREALMRLRHIQEEVGELAGALLDDDVREAADAAVDLAYLAVGTCVSLGVDFDAFWAEVQRANMEKMLDPENPSRPAKPSDWLPPLYGKDLPAARRPDPWGWPT
ncbi:MAG: nucleoside triphosphate pyrophosphohydrolase family protein [Planctomycetes bacterium]|nr:nucleoside triphosphate pyrophosphohydrolase family protein [Planctomycetota bacterium]